MQTLQSFDPGGIISVMWIDLANFVPLARLSLDSFHEPETLTIYDDTYNYTPSSSSSARLETSRRLAARRRCPSHGHNHPISNNFHTNTSLIIS